MTRFVGSRRQFLTSAATLSAVAIGGCLSTLGLDDESGLSKVGVESLAWEDTSLVIEFDPSFDEWEGWIIYHEYEDPIDYNVIGGEYPRVDEPQKLPFVELLQESGQDTYSTTTFEIASFDGTSSPWEQNRDFVFRMVDEWGPSVSFEVPTRVLKEAGVWSGE